MKTDDLISMLAAGEPAMDRLAMAKRFALALLVGGVAAVVLMALYFGVRPDLAEVARTPVFWAKLALPGSLALGSLWLSTRLARPGVEGGAAWASLCLPIIVVWLAAIAALWQAPTEARMPMLLGISWKECPFNIAMLSVPGFISVFWALRGLAPTRLRLAGAGGGLLAGSTATLAYCLHCPEIEVPFWGVWYLSGMLLPALFGAIVGPYLLRW